MKFFTVLYNTLFWSLLVSFIMFKNTWIEMRINIGTVMFILWILFFIIFYKLYFIKNIFKFSIINFIIFAILSLIILKPYGLISVPSSIIREGLHLTGILNLNVINAVLSIFIILGILLIYIFKKLKRV
ncbi:hypothetical protein [Brachyspira aalborgi]|uniref:Uncharacterized protein n=2 Tax=Brachyspira aalborgi TaxID=29522 RepID=A0A5C8CKB6_9SPIR|nr:hypothetical protein [Brachyspira aalborgi]TXJ13477.1 hypothetical protein EPJ80_01675 [Brachyspira aalborgi]